MGFCIQWIRVLHPLNQLPFRTIGLDPFREPVLTDPCPGICRIVLRVAGVYDHVAPGSAEESTHIRLKHVIFNQVVYDIEREGEIGQRAVVRIKGGEGLGRIPLEQDATSLHRDLADVVSAVGGISRKRELVPITASELDHISHGMIPNEIVQEARLELSELTVGAAAGIST